MRWLGQGLGAVFAAIFATAASGDDIYARIIAANPDPLTVAHAATKDAAAALGADIVLAENPRRGAPLFLYVDRDRLADHPGFALTAALYDNYALFEEDPERNTEAEGQEVVAFLTHVFASPEMAVARRYIEDRLGRRLTDKELRDAVLTRWFRQFSQGDDPDLSGFEHVFVGEAEGADVQGLHFWHRYWTEEVAGRTTLYADKRRRGERATPSVTLAFDWYPEDPETGETAALEKPIGGFLVGLRPAALIAIGLVRGTGAIDPPKTLTLDGHRWEVVLHGAPGRASIRTIYTVYQGR